MAFVVMLIIMIGTLWVAGEEGHWSPNIQQQALSASQAFPKTPQPAQNSAVYQGLQLFSSKGCITCHNINGVGGYRGPDLSSVANRYTDDQITYIVMTGRGNMPAFASNITKEEWQSLLAFLDTRHSEDVLPHVQAPPPTQAAPTQQVSEVEK
jgi:ubiquinol-cytochrome c reductase cytochrome b subunit